jgi:hypothetical protein
MVYKNKKLHRKVTMDQHEYHQKKKTRRTQVLWNSKQFLLSLVASVVLLLNDTRIM